MVLFTKPAFVGFTCLRHAFRANSRQQQSCRFVGRVLRDQLALEGAFEDALAKAGGTFDGSIGIIFHCLISDSLSFDLVTISLVHPQGAGGIPILQNDRLPRCAMLTVTVAIF